MFARNPLQAVVLLMFLLAALSARATSFQDMWWNENESGSGYNVIQQGDVLFVTWFVYDGTNRPYWFSATATRVGSSNTFNGGVFETKGSPFFAPYSPNNTATVEVGRATFTFTDHKSGTLAYTVNGQSVTKPITRFTFVNTPVAASFRGGFIATTTGCNRNDGPSNASVTLDVNMVPVPNTAGGTIALTERGPDYVCVYTGSYTRYGSFADASGQVSCSGSASSVWTMTEIQSSDTSFAGKLAIPQGSNSTCRLTATLGGIRQP